MIADYQELSQRTSQWPRGSDGYRGEQHRRYAAMSLAGEAGEVVDALKKHLAGQPLDRDKVRLELGDVAWSIAAVCEVQDLNFATVMTPKIVCGLDVFKVALQLSRRATFCASIVYDGRVATIDLVHLCEVFLALVGLLDFTLEEVLTANLAKLATRYPLGIFREEDSIARRDVAR